MNAKVMDAVAFTLDEDAHVNMVKQRCTLSLMESDEVIAIEKVTEGNQKVNEKRRRMNH